MKYVVTRYFKDAQDNLYVYHEGDTYPREGYTASDSRIKDLLSGNNFQRVPLIKRDKSNVKKSADKVSKPEVVTEPVVEETPETEVITETVSKDTSAPNPEVTWTAEEIQKMPFMKLKSIAKKNGVEVDERKAEEIRTALKEKLGI